jgi:uncharacterized protein (TIGR02301 family)
VTWEPLGWATVAVLASLALHEAAWAQGLPANPPLPPVAGSGPAAGSVSPPPDPGDGLPPYEPQLERLAERLGTLTYLRGLCGHGDAAEWRNRMAALLDAEAKASSRRDRLAGAYNHGFRGYQATYRSCTPSAELVISRFLAESDQLARELATRYGGS